MMDASGSRDSLVIVSSVRPSHSGSRDTSWVRFANGNTAIDGPALSLGSGGVWVLVEVAMTDVRPPNCTRYARTGLAIFLTECSPVYANDTDVMRSTW